MGSHRERHTPTYTPTHKHELHIEKSIRLSPRTNHNTVRFQKFTLSKFVEYCPIAKSRFKIWQLESNLRDLCFGRMFYVLNRASNYTTAVNAVRDDTFWNIFSAWNHGFLRHPLGGSQHLALQIFLQSYIICVNANNYK